MMTSFTTQGPKQEKIALVNHVYVYPANTTPEPSKLDDSHIFNAVWDTGATGTAIKDTIAQRLGLLPVKKCITFTANGSCECNVYYLDILLPNKVLITKFLVIGYEKMLPDMLIGMDIISLGDFAVSSFGTEIVFTFRMPAQTPPIDFVKDAKKPKFLGHLPGKDDPCPCGSEKKYKNCCGAKK